MGAMQDAIDIYASQDTLKDISARFPFLLPDWSSRATASAPATRFHEISTTKPFDLLDIEVQPLAVHHGMVDGSPLISLGFAFDRRLAYISDLHFIPPATEQLLRRVFPAGIPTVRLQNCILSTELIRGTANYRNGLLTADSRALRLCSGCRDLPKVWSKARLHNSNV